MASRLNIKIITMQNFRSFRGKTSIDVADLGPVLVLGTNGSGKTTAFAESIIWCLFGRTTRHERPGDRIINFYEKKDCFVQIETTDGWRIRRSRKFKGHDDLIIFNKDIECSRSTNENAQRFLNKKFNLDFDIFTSSICFGQDCKTFLDQSQQKRKAILENILAIDKLNVWSKIAKEKSKDICSECNVLSLRLKDIENFNDKLILQIEKNKLSRDDYEKNQVNQISIMDGNISKLKVALSSIVAPDIDEIVRKWSTINQINAKLVDLKLVLSDYNKKEHVDRTNIKIYKQKLEDYQAKLDKISTIPIDKIIEDHKIADKEQMDVDNAKELLTKIVLNYEKIANEINVRNDIIKSWNKLDNKVCTTCQQYVPHTHVDSKMSPHQEEIDKLKAELVRLQIARSQLEFKLNHTKIDRPSISIADIKNLVIEKDEIKIEVIEISEVISELESELFKTLNKSNALKEQIVAADRLIEVHQPNMSVDRAKLLLHEVKTISDKIYDIEQQKKDKIESQNPYSCILQDLVSELGSFKKEHKDILEKLTNLDVLSRHYTYIDKAYGDRNKVKKLVLSKLIPYLNDRMHFYENLFGFDFGLKFDDSLSIETKRWDYSDYSGGERKRISIALMFAMYDLTMMMYGPQCNVLLMDEIDGGLDDDGVNAFVQAILEFQSIGNDRPNTVFVISHKSAMLNNFPSEITIKNINGDSILE